MKTQPAKSPRESLCSRFLILLILAVLSPASVVLAQTTTFTYQGRFTDGGTAANGTYDMQFKLFDSPSVGAGNQVGATIANGAVVITNGVFTVPLDFGGAGFSGADRFLEIGVRLAGDGNAYTLLSPRQQLTSAVYAIRAGSATTADTATTAASATNATQLGGIAADKYVQAADARLSDSRTPTAGSAFYIQNSTNQQAGGNFNVSGDGTIGGTLAANVVSAGTQFNFGPFRFLGAAGSSNTFVGINAGTANSSGGNNVFVGTFAGNANTTGSYNSMLGVGAGGANTGGHHNAFFGASAGQLNTTGDSNAFFGAFTGVFNTIGKQNAFFGSQAGGQNTEGLQNSFFGAGSGYANTTGYDNSFFGTSSGTGNTIGTGNSFFGIAAGGANVSGAGNTFLGTLAGQTNKTGNSNTSLGYLADVGSNNLSNATAIGANARVTQSNALVLGSIKNLNGGTADTNVGIGTTAPAARLHIAQNFGNFLAGDAGCALGTFGLSFGPSLSGCTNFSILGNGTSLYFNRATVGVIDFVSSTGNSTIHDLTIDQNSVAIFHPLSLNSLGSAGNTQLCRNALNQISTCSSSLRYKTNLQPFTGGLSVLNRLKPITFDWKDGGLHDLGFGAEDVAAIEPLLVTRNAKDEVEGVKYDRITAVLVNAVKEQQEQIKRQEKVITSLKSLVCRRNRHAAVCQ